MIQPLNIKETERTPGIVLDKENGNFEIAGKSIPEDATGFFTPALAWISKYSQEANSSTEFVFKFEYYNTATGKIIFDILSALEKIEGSKVVWAYLESDRDMEDSGLDFAELVNLPFEFKAY